MSQYFISDYARAGQIINDQFQSVLATHMRASGLATYRMHRFIEDVQLMGGNEISLYMSETESLKLRM